MRGFLCLLSLAFFGVLPAIVAIVDPAARRADPALLSQGVNKVKEIKNAHTDPKGIPNDRRKELAADAKDKWKEFENGTDLKKLLPKTGMYDPMKDAMVFRDAEGAIAVGRGSRMGGPNAHKVFTVKKWTSHINMKTKQCHPSSEFVHDWGSLHPVGYTPKNGMWIKNIARVILTREPFTKMFHWKTHKPSDYMCRVTFGEVFLRALEPRAI